MPEGADTALRIRGIYATALTRLFLDRGFRVTDPSAPLRDRIGPHPRLQPGGDFQVAVKDRDDGQGIVLHGPPERVSQAVEALWTECWDGIRRPEADAAVSLEFPFHAKECLDEIRHRVTPTLVRHHFLRLIAQDGGLDLGEAAARRHHPEDRLRLGRKLEQALVWETLHAGKTLDIEHVKLKGAPLSLSPGTIAALDPKGGRLALRREFTSCGRYDGLDVPLYAGDYALVEFRAGQWHYRQRYFRADGQWIGSYWNINTGLEIYPGKVRYVDLELDVAEWPDGRRALLDRPLLDQAAASGRITPRLRARAEATAALLLNAPPSGPH